MVHGRSQILLAAMFVAHFYQYIPTFLHLFSLFKCPQGARNPQVDPQFMAPSHCGIPPSNSVNVTRSLMFDVPWVLMVTLYWLMQESLIGSRPGTDATVTLGGHSEFSASFGWADWSSEWLGVCLQRQPVRRGGRTRLRIIPHEEPFLLSSWGLCSWLLCLFGSGYTCGPFLILFTPLSFNNWNLTNFTLKLKLNSCRKQWHTMLFLPGAFYGWRRMMLAQSPLTSNDGCQVLIHPLWIHFEAETDLEECPWVTAHKRLSSK